jgi:dihydroorotase
MIKAAKKKGLKVTCDVAAHQLLLDDSHLVNFDTNYKVNPPLRGPETIKALVKGIKDGTIDVLVSDHRPEDEEGKKLEFDRAAFGMLGIQELGAMIQEISKQVDLNLLIEKITYQPRRLLGLEIPAIRKGQKAVLTFFDPSKKWFFDESSNQSKSRNSPNFGKELTGKAVAVFNNGKVLLDSDLMLN